MIIFFLLQSYILSRVATYLSPALLYMYGKWLLNPEFVNKLFFRGSILGVTLISTFLLRSYGRAINPKYKAFHQDLVKAKLEYSVNNKVCITNLIVFIVICNISLNLTII